MIETIEASSLLSELKKIILSNKYKFLSKHYVDEFVKVYSALSDEYDEYYTLSQTNTYTQEEIDKFDYLSDLYTEGYYYHIGFDDLTFETGVEGKKIFNMEEYNDIVKRFNDCYAVFDAINAKYRTAS